jgi:predicted GIY-YIG superfamily endonuclease
VDSPRNTVFIASSISKIHDDVREAIVREKQLKRWRRAWKIELIERQNGDWHDLWPGLAQQ